MTGKKDQEYTTFFLAFSGLNITLTTDIMCSMTADSEHGSIVETYPLAYEGILLDYDHENYYLGNSENPNEITQFVPKNRVLHGKINDEVVDFLKNLPRPQNEGEIN